MPEFVGTTLGSAQVSSLQLNRPFPQFSGGLTGCAT
jgi:hypothetical protein